MRAYTRFAVEFRRFTLAVLTTAAIVAVFFLFVSNAAGADRPAGTQKSVVSDGEIQAAIDQKFDQAAADRQAIQVMLQREDIRQAAGSAGLDLERASAAAAVLSGPTLEMLAAQARTVNEDGVAGGEGRVVLTTTAIIIILLIIILLVD